MSPKQGRVQSELRRKEAADLLVLGHSVEEVAQRLNLNPRSIHRWFAGQGILRKKGRTHGLGKAQREQLHHALLRRKTALGLPPGSWKTPEIQAIIAFFYGVRVEPVSIDKFLTEFGWKRLGAGQVWDKPPKVPPTPAGKPE